jgi:hypothetical protein
MFGRRCYSTSSKETFNTNTTGNLLSLKLESVPIKLLSHNYYLHKVSQIKSSKITVGFYSDSIFSRWYGAQIDLWKWVIIQSIENLIFRDKPIILNVVALYQTKILFATMVFPTNQSSSPISYPSTFPKSHISHQKDGLPTKLGQKNNFYKISVTFLSKPTKE